jgi:hypothetical protein
VPTLIGLGAHEAMPTLFDIADEDEPTCPQLPTLRTLSQSPGEERIVVLVPWEDDDDDDCCFDV